MPSTAQRCKRRWNASVASPLKRRAPQSTKVLWFALWTSVRLLTSCPEKTGWSTSHRSPTSVRSEEHTSELQSRGHLVCRLLLEKKKTLRNQSESLGSHA